ncbi:MAG: type II toxin-antitoxin system VapC family toxin [Deltaproteobacteria bacterium]|nr:type II toxin-antitoxin system VapC family toxin [Deltaproteobacteria bacterium]
MSGRVLLDTNIVIAIFADDYSVRRALEETEEVFVPVIVLGELYYGAHKSSRVETNIRRISEFAMNCSVVTCDTETSRLYGKIKDVLRLKGRPIPENDIWIAAIAKQYAMTLVSRDDHFKEIDNLVTLSW